MIHTLIMILIKEKYMKKLLITLVLSLNILTLQASESDEAIDNNMLKQFNQLMLNFNEMEVFSSIHE